MKEDRVRRKGLSPRASVRATLVAICSVRPYRLWVLYSLTLSCLQAEGDIVLAPSIVNKCSVNEYVYKRVDISILVLDDDGDVIRYDRRT